MVQYRAIFQSSTQQNISECLKRLSLQKESLKRHNLTFPLTNFDRNDFKEKAPTLLYNSNLHFFGRCLRSSVSTSSIIFNLEHLPRKSFLSSFTIIICHKFASSCQNGCQNLPHMRLTPVYIKKTWQNIYQT